MVISDSCRGVRDTPHCRQPRHSRHVEEHDSAATRLPANAPGSFIPSASGIVTCMYYTGIDLFTRQEVYGARQLRDRKLQRALMQFFKPENYFEVREAILKANRPELIGGGCDCLIPAQPSKEAIEARRRQDGEAARSEYVHKIPNPGKGYRPGRKTAGRQERKRIGERKGLDGPRPDVSR
jgi:hypothetical protein